MENLKIPLELAALLQKADFIHVGTSDEHGQPSVASKFLLKIDGNSVYLADMVKGKTRKNVQCNPFISLAVMDEDNLRNYQINGTAKAIEAGSEFDILALEFTEKQVSFATSRIISGVQRLNPHKGEAFSSNQVKVFYKVSVSEVLEVGPTVRLKKETSDGEEQDIYTLIIGLKSNAARRLRQFAEKNRQLTIVAAFALILLLGLLDYLTGYDIDISILLLVPIILVSLSAKERLAFITSFISALVWLLSEEWARGWHFPWGIILWNALIRMGFFFIIVKLIYVLMSRIEKEKMFARSDFLTGIANSRHFSDLLAAELKRLARDGRPFTLAYFDVDNFKVVNDGSGHNAGDKLLRLIADTLKRSVREIDIVGRLGGDEFAVLFPLTDQKQARSALERMQKALLDSVRRSGYPVTFSIGAVTYLSATASGDEALKQADDKMYEAKKQGKNSIRYGVFGQSYLRKEFVRG